MLGSIIAHAVVAVAGIAGIAVLAAIHVVPGSDALAVIVGVLTASGVLAGNWSSSSSSSPAAPAAAPVVSSSPARPVAAVDAAVGA